jgi:NAD-dependent SIR2 family protein deacetylase
MTCADCGWQGKRYDVGFITDDVEACPDCRSPRLVEFEEDYRREDGYGHGV